MIQNNITLQNSILKNRMFMKSSNRSMDSTYSHEAMNNSHDLNFQGLSSSKVSKWFYTSDNVKKFLEFVERKQLIFDAAFALILTCILRPASIVLIPGDKNKDDQKYAAAHSIASGVIGFAISNIIFTPVSNGIKKLTDGIKTNPEKFIKNPTSYLLKDDKKCLKTAKTYLDRLPDVVCSIPKGILTIALIPPILKYVFGMEKKKDNNKKETLVKADYSFKRSSNSEHSNDLKITQNIIGGTK